jgi:hypothetical protein
MRERGAPRGPPRTGWIEIDRGHFYHGAAESASTPHGLEAETNAEELADLGVPLAAIGLIPRGATRGQAMAAVVVSKALSGDDKAAETLLKRPWPAPKPVDIVGDTVQNEIVVPWQRDGAPDRVVPTGCGTLAEIARRSADS